MTTTLERPIVEVDQQGDVVRAPTATPRARRRPARRAGLVVRRIPWAVAYGTDNIGRCVERRIVTEVDPAP